MNEEMQKYLEGVSACICLTDIEGSTIAGLTGGDTKKAYAGGVVDGKIQFARELLNRFGDKA